MMSRGQYPQAFPKLVLLEVLPSWWCCLALLKSTGKLELEEEIATRRLLHLEMGSHSQDLQTIKSDVEDRFLRVNRQDH